jgi:hypothetical protein
MAVTGLRMPPVRPGTRPCCHARRSRCRREVRARPLFSRTRRPAPPPGASRSNSSCPRLRSRIIVALRNTTIPRESFRSNLPRDTSTSTNESRSPRKCPSASISSSTSQLPRSLRGSRRCGRCSDDVVWSVPTRHEAHQASRVFLGHAAQRESLCPDTRELSQSLPECLGDFAVAVRGHEQQRRRRELLGGELEEQQRGSIRPVNVLENQEMRQTARTRAAAARGWRRRAENDRRPDPV